MTERPLLSLVMIVKNESRSIRATIESVKPFVDRYLILDTGSTDGTQAIIKEAFEGVEGEVVEEPFIDFGTSRNRALELAGGHTIFTLMLSGDETLHGGEALRKFADEHRESLGQPHGAYHVKVHYGSTHFDSPRLARADAGWRYVGVTHEVLSKEKTPPPSIRVPDAHIVHDLSHRDPRGSRRRWELDLRLLTEEARRKPNDTRTQFYLAQTLECLGNHKGAFAAYEKRVKMGGWQEEVYESLFRLARVSRLLGKPWPEVQQRFLDAHAHSPQRAEPLFAIAWYYYEKKNWPLTYLFASRGAQIPFPEKATLFVEAEVYQTKLLDLVGTSAYYVGEFEAGEAAIRKAIENKPDEPRFLKNLAFYDERKKPKPRGGHREIPAAARPSSEQAAEQAAPSAQPAAAPAEQAAAPAEQPAATPAEQPAAPEQAPPAAAPEPPASPEGSS
jgi:glycosyltransferase involved in cell wall biosynthesis